MEEDWYPECPFFTGGGSAAQTIHPRCLSVNTALRDCAGLLFKEFALVVLDENGEEKVFTSAALTPYQQRIFTDRFRVGFHSSVRRVFTREWGQDRLESHLYGGHYGGRANSGDSFPGEGIRHQFQLQSAPADAVEDGCATRERRKRSRSRPSRGSHPDGHNTAAPAQKTRRLQISDERDIECFYLASFKEMQQDACKIMGKAFVKFVEPRKQSHYPYTKGDIGAPPWWPYTKGDQAVRHKEPDHLRRPERIRLLVHILRMVAGPRDKQCTAVQKLDLNIKKLEEETTKSMSSWFDDKGRTEGKSKEVLLKEIFKVARAEERYKKGEIDDTTYVPVMVDNRYGVYGSDDDRANEGIEEEDGVQQIMPVPTHFPTPGDLSSPSTMILNGPLPGPSDFYSMHTIPIRQHIESHSNNNTLSDDGQYLYFGRQPQRFAQLDQSHHPLPSFMCYPPQQNMCGWENGTASRANVDLGPTTRPSDCILPTTPGHLRTLLRDPLFSPQPMSLEASQNVG